MISTSELQYPEWKPEDYIVFIDDYNPEQWDSFAKKTMNTSDFRSLWKDISKLCPLVKEWKVR